MMSRYSLPITSPRTMSSCGQIGPTLSALRTAVQAVLRSERGTEVDRKRDGVWCVFCGGGGGGCGGCGGCGCGGDGGVCVVCGVCAVVVVVVVVCAWWEWGRGVRSHERETGNRVWWWRAEDG